VRSIFFISFLLSCALSLTAQKINKESVAYTYVRNPLERLDDSITSYSVEVDVTWFKKEKQKQETYELELAKAEDEYQQALKAYNGKNTTSKLAEIALLGEGKPKRREIEKPSLLPQPDISALSSVISLDGYSRGNENSLLIKVVYQDIHVGSHVDVKKRHKDTEYKKRSITVRQPVALTVTTPDGKILLNQIIESSRKDKIIESKLIEAGSDWYKFVNSNWYAFYRYELMKHYENIAKEINDLIDNRFGYSNVQRTTNLYRGRGKSFSYENHLLASRKAQRAYESLITERQESVEKLKESVAFWEEELTEAEPSNKKARISSTIVQALTLNIIEAKTLIGDYDGAIDHCDKLDSMSDAKKKYITKSERLRKFVKDERLRNK